VSGPAETIARRQAWEPLLAAAIVGALAGLYGWALFVLSFRHDGLIGPRFNAPGLDFTVFWQGAREALSGDLGQLFDGARFTATLNQEFAAWLSAPLPLHPWIYPPHFLLLLLPVGLLPFPAAYALFLAVTFALAAVALLAGERGLRCMILGSALALAPGTALTAITGQNAFLTAALLVGGFRLIGARPMLGGALLGVLTVKPQLFLMVPVALVAAREFRALGACVLAAASLVVASVLLFGWAPWQAWLGAVLGPGNELHRGWTKLSLLWGESVYTDALLLGARSYAAAASQGLATLLAAAAVARASKNLAVVLAATVLAAPHVAPYDTILLAIAAALFFARGIERGMRSFELPLALMLWLAALYGPPILSPAGFLPPLLILAFLARSVAQPP